MHSASVRLGVFYHPQLARQTLALAGKLRLIAVTSAPAEDDAAFAEIRAKFTFSLHYWLGGYRESLPEEALLRLEEMAALLRPEWVVERIESCEMSDGGRRLEEPLAPLYTQDSLEQFCRFAGRVRRRVTAPLAWENVPGYLPAGGAEMREGEFIRRLLKQTGSKLALNLPAIWVSAHHANCTPMEYLEEFPLEDTGILQVAGMEQNLDLGGPWISPSPPSDEMLTLMEFVTERTPKLQVILLDACFAELPPPAFAEGVERITLKARFASA